MKYISIGNACNVKQQIQKYKGGCETLFFDWLMTDMDSVNSIIGCNDINDLLFFDNVGIDPNEPICYNNSRIIVKSLPFCVSIHDIKIQFTDKDIHDFIDKYKRRYERIINFIKSKEKIYFMRYGRVTKEERDCFINNVKKINPDCNFALISINIEQPSNIIFKDQHYLEINLNNKNVVGNTTTSFLNWRKIFYSIEKYI